MNEPSQIGFKEGQRFLCRIPNISTTISEANVIEISPSGEYIYLTLIDNKGDCLGGWYRKEEIEIIEMLATLELEKLPEVEKPITIKEV